MQFTISFQGNEEVKNLAQTEVVIGRAKEGLKIDLDLGSDRHVSRPHARIWTEQGQCWIEDLNSRRGTKVNDHEIKGKGKTPLQSGDVISVGETTLRFESSAGQDVDLNSTTLPPAAVDAEPDLEVAVTLDARATPRFSNKAGDKETAVHLDLLYQMPLQFAQEPSLDRLLNIIVEQSVNAITGATRGALVLKDRTNQKLLLKAHVASDEPAISETLANRAMTEGKGFIWERDESIEIPQSMARHQVQTGMYAPLIWQNKALGVLCVDNPQRPSAFKKDDLRLLVAIAHYAAMTVANHYAQEDLRRHSDFTNRLLCSRFPPRLRTKLMELTSTGALPMGTQQSLVTVLISDIRGFTELSAQIGPQRMSDMLNEYFPPLIEVIFDHNGTIERFVGDAIFAVFGSPEPDDKQQENALRAALAMQEVVNRLNAARRARGTPTCGLGIGIDCGEVLHGFIGNADRIEFTVLGNAANFASRYCNGAKPGEILISPEVHSRVWNLVLADKTTIKTKHEGDIPAHRVKAIKS
jgi:Adenylate cyclase, family 3 (some proteins contain HAMP domain)